MQNPCLASRRWKLQGGVPAACPDRSRLLPDVGLAVMRTVFQTPCQALGGTELSPEDPALNLGRPEGTSHMRFRGWRREVSGDWASQSS